MYGNFHLLYDVYLNPGADISKYETISFSVYIPRELGLSVGDLNLQLQLGKNSSDDVSWVTDMANFKIGWNVVKFTLSSPSYVNPLAGTLQEILSNVHIARLSVVTGNNANGPLLKEEIGFKNLCAGTSAVNKDGNIDKCEICSQNVFRNGDVNADGSVNSADSLITLQASVLSVQLTDEQFVRADVNGDKKIRSVDALLILHYSVGKITSFPID